MLERLGETTRRREGREVLLTIDLPEPAIGAVRWRALLRQFAAGALEPARTVIDRLWPRRLGAPGELRANVIVVGTDGSAHAGGALDVAAELARLSGARLEVVAAHGFLVADARELRSTVSQAVERLRASGLTAGEHVRRGDPALVLTDVADEERARLIVVGAGERTKTARRLIGSVADAVAERSPCDVLIVRPRS